MNENEKALFFELCRLRRPNKERLRALIEIGGATYRVLGLLCMNRMAGVAYEVLRLCGLLGAVGREFLTPLRSIYEYNIQLNADYRKCVEDVSHILHHLTGKYTMLKGAYLNFVYPPGCRTSHDIDLLAAGESLDEIEAALLQAGYTQGYLKNGVFTPADRGQIIRSRMMRGETVPFVKETGMERLKYCEVDLNFSLDCKNTDDIDISQFITGSALVCREGMECAVPQKPRFLVHLCMHLFKEATVYEWVKMGRDMSMYKYTDIDMMLSDMGEEDTEETVHICHSPEVRRAVAYVMRHICEMGLSSAEAAGRILSLICTDGEREPDGVVWYAGKKRYVFTEEDPAERLMHPNRTGLLREVPYEAS